MHLAEPNDKLLNIDQRTPYSHWHPYIYIFGMREQSIDTSTNTHTHHLEKEHIECVSVLYRTRHNINRICQTRKIHQSATHLYSHRSISRHQFIAFAFIVDQTATQLKTGETEKERGRERESEFVSHTGNIVAAGFYDVHA